MDDQIGLLWDPSNINECFEVLNRELINLSHASRCSGEQPMVIMSRRQLEIGSFPIVEQVESSWTRFNEEVQAETNIVGHIFLGQNEVDIIAGFAGAKGNLMWFNSGKADLLCRLKTGKSSKSIVLESGFGFCLGKRERYTKVYISSLERASDEFMGVDGGSSNQAHAMFFACDSGDEGSWLKELNSEKQAVE